MECNVLKCSYSILQWGEGGLGWAFALYEFPLFCVNSVLKHKSCTQLVVVLCAIGDLVRLQVPVCISISIE